MIRLAYCRYSQPADAPGSPGWRKADEARARHRLQPHPRPVTAYALLQRPVVP